MNMHSPWLLIKAAWEILELALVVASLYFAVRLYSRYRQPTWMEPLDRRRVAILWLFALGAAAIKISEDVLGGESGPVDEGIMLFLHSHVPSALMDFFEAVTFSASAPVLTSL